MKKILITLVILFMGFTAYSQEYFIKRYNTILTNDEQRIPTDTYVEFNVYNGSDVVVHFDSLEPVRYTQEAEPVKDEYEGLTYQLVLMRLADSERVFSFALFETGELIMLSLDNGKSILLTNYESESDTKIFKKIR